jgi:methylenetetrahydrofolate--tRNA-(uracil-5-)-methyltransferase
MNKTSSHSPIHVIGGGLAGSEAAWQIAKAGIPGRAARDAAARGTDAHKTDGLAELVCSNSFRSDDSHSAMPSACCMGDAPARLADHGLRRCHQVPAGGALAVDRDGFSDAVTKALERHPLITIDRAEVAGLPPKPNGTMSSSRPAP